MKFHVVLEPSEEGGYTVFVPALPGCISEGEDIDDALSNIQEAIELYLEPVEESLSLGEGAIVQEIVL
ncbi:MAG: type II toxin-antitoxin system HicB family antitoxin [Cyanothece sp. SIO2G6]|nr:type II toxin-antitoxin system HicB family antitoxin [Cyanothece sp. SIO2G6]